MGIGPNLSVCSTPRKAMSPSHCIHQSDGFMDGGRRCKSNPCPYEQKLTAGNPVPTNFNISGLHQRGKHTIVIVTYPDANNYEGKKILFFKNTTAAEIDNMKTLDPHFCEDKHLSPFARFEPTPEGYSAAVLLADNL